MYDKKPLLIPLFSVIAIVLLSVLLYAHSINSSQPTLPIDKETDLSTLKKTYTVASDYANRYLGEKYELHSVRGECDKNLKGKIEFIYTKRSGAFRDVRFICVDTSLYTIASNRQSEAERLYGRDLHVDINDWKIDFDNILQMAADRNYDIVSFQTKYDSAITIKYLKGGNKVYTVDADFLSGQVIGSYGTDGGQMGTGTDGTDGTDGDVRLCEN